MLTRFRLEEAGAEAGLFPAAAPFSRSAASAFNRFVRVIMPVFG